jgi:hypothetical protein
LPIFNDQGADSSSLESSEAAATDDLTTNESSEGIKKADRRWATLFETAPEITRHTIALLLSLFSLWLIHLALKHLLGDPKFFGVIPVQWIIDVGDIIILIKFIWHLIKNFNK